MNKVNRLITKPMSCIFDGKLKMVVPILQGGVIVLSFEDFNKIKHQLENYEY